MSVNVNEAITEQLFDILAITTEAARKMAVTNQKEAAEKALEFNEAFGEFVSKVQKIYGFGA